MLALTRSFVIADLISHIAKVCLLRDKVVTFQVCSICVSLEEQLQSQDSCFVASTSPPQCDQLFVSCSPLHKRNHVKVPTLLPTAIPL